ncbi:hydroxyacylglutathione hydrolase [Colwelliaceae bacterium 6441]
MSQSTIATKNFIFAIKAFSDNYIWAIRHSESNYLALVDPGDAQVCIDYIEENHLILSAILITHHHADHIGGIAKLYDHCQAKKWPIEVFGPKNETIPFANHHLVEDDHIELKHLDLSFSVIDLPGHTLGHIAYYTDGILFCGDTLFSGGCGRIFEGTPSQMFHSLEKLKNLPERTHVYCTHEYTLANLKFALTVDPSNSELIHYYNQVLQLVSANKKTLPSSILTEKQINPFFRCDDMNISQSVNEYSNGNAMDELATFTYLRQWKDSF